MITTFKDYLHKGFDFELCHTDNEFFYLVSKNSFNTTIKGKDVKYRFVLCGEAKEGNVFIQMRAVLDFRYWDVDKLNLFVKTWGIDRSEFAQNIDNTTFYDGVLYNTGFSMSFTSYIEEMEVVTDYRHLIENENVIALTYSVLVNECEKAVNEINLISSKLKIGDICIDKWRVCEFKYMSNAYGDNNLVGKKVIAGNRTEIVKITKKGVIGV